MKLPRRDLANAIAERTLNVRDSKKLARAIAAYLLDERRTHELESIIRDIMQYRLEHGYVEANVVSAHDLPAVVIKDVKEILRGQYPKADHTAVDTELDPSAVGGLRIDMPNEQLDMTVHAKLTTFKRLTASVKE